MMQHPHAIPPHVTRHASGVLTLVAMLTLGTSVNGGPLDPPAGPVTPVYKNLTEVEPRTPLSATNTPGDADTLFKITQPGSYYLTANTTGVASKNGITITTNDVTLDLGGFVLEGVSGSLAGILAVGADLEDITIRDGAVRNWGHSGIDLYTDQAIQCAVLNVHASHNGIHGIATGWSTQILDCRASHNAQAGFFAGLGGVISGCTAELNTNDGIHPMGACTVTNGTTRENGWDGMWVGYDCTISNCTAYHNSGSGIHADSGTTITNVSAASNLHQGLDLGATCSATGVTARDNVMDGIRVNTRCHVYGNLCSSNGSGTGGDGAGIHVTGGDNRIEGNVCTTADRGIDVDATGNYVARNTCSGNTTNWTIVVGNAVAPILNATTNGSAISGSTYTGSLGSTDPNANYSY